MIPHMFPYMFSEKECRKRADNYRQWMAFWVPSAMTTAALLLVRLPYQGNTFLFPFLSLRIGGERGMDQLLNGAE